MALQIDPSTAQRWSAFVTQVLNASASVGYVSVQPAGGGPQYARVEWTQEYADTYGFTLDSAAVTAESARTAQDATICARLLALRTVVAPLLGEHRALRLRPYTHGGISPLFSVDIAVQDRGGLPPGVVAPREATHDVFQALDGVEEADLEEEAVASQDTDEDSEVPVDSDEDEVDADGDVDAEADDEDDEDNVDALRAKLRLARVQAALAKAEAEKEALRAQNLLLAQIGDERGKAQGKGRGKGKGKAPPAELGANNNADVLKGLVPKQGPEGFNLVVPEIDSNALADAGLEETAFTSINAAFLQMVHSMRIGSAAVTEAAARTAMIYQAACSRLESQNADLFERHHAALGVLVENRRAEAASALEGEQTDKRMAALTEAAKTLIMQGRSYFGDKQLLDALESLPADRRAVVLSRLAQARVGSSGGGEYAGGADDAEPAAEELPDELAEAEAEADAEDAALSQEEQELAAAMAAEALARAAEGDAGLADVLQMPHVQDALHDPVLQEALKDEQKVAMLRAFLQST